MFKLEKYIRDNFLPYIVKIKSLKKITLLIAVVAFCYFISLKFIFPAYFDPLVPHHPDYFYTYGGFSAMSWMNIFFYPRPIGFLILKIIGILGMKGVIIFLILFSFINILLTINFVKKISNLKIYWPILILYLFLIFSHPGFYFNYTYDFFDAVAYFFAILAMLYWLKMGENLKPIYFVFISILIGLSFFSKETYIVAVLIFLAWHFAFKKNKIRKNAAIMFLVAVGITIAVLIQSRISQSIWVNFASSVDNPYFINLNPRSIWETFYFYINGWANIGVWVIIILSLLIIATHKKYIKEFLLLLFMGLAIYAPYSILPNHKYGYYFWLGVPLGYAVILLLQPAMIKNILAKVANKKIGTFVSTIFVVVFISLSLFSLRNDNQQIKSVVWAWAMQQEKNNKVILASLPTLKNNIKENDHILITGMNIETSPFSCQDDHMDVYFDKNNDFIDNYFGKSHNWTIFKYGKYIPKSCGLISYTNDGNLNLNDYDLIFIFASDGRLIKTIYKDEVAALKDSSTNGALSRESILHPEL
jgi:hypothetical protein